MTRTKIKVYGWTGFYPGTSQQMRYICAAASKAHLARLTGLTMYFINGWVCVTGNAKEIETAMNKPAVMFTSKLNDRGGDYREVPDVAS